MKGYKVLMCWLCAKRRQFSAYYDEDGENWRGFVCGHALWSQRQWDAEKRATAKEAK